MLSKLASSISARIRIDWKEQSSHPAAHTHGNKRSKSDIHFGPSKIHGFSELLERMRDSSDTSTAGDIANSYIAARRKRWDSDNTHEHEESYLGTKDDDHIELLGKIKFAHGRGGDDIISADRHSGQGVEIYGGRGNDWLQGTNKNDALFGRSADRNHGKGENLLEGFAGDDGLYGAGGNDLLYGGDGNDFIDGKKGDDVLDGGNGDDIFMDDGGDNLIIGGSGTDVAAYSAEGLKDIRMEKLQDGTYLLSLKYEGSNREQRAVLNGIEYVHFGDNGSAGEINLASDPVQTTFSPDGPLAHLRDIDILDNATADEPHHHRHQQEYSWNMYLRQRN